MCWGGGRGAAGERGGGKDGGACTFRRGSRILVGDLPCGGKGVGVINNPWSRSWGGRGVGGHKYLLLVVSFYETYFDTLMFSLRKKFNSKLKVNKKNKCIHF